MNIGTPGQKPLKVVLDTNILVSGLVFGGKPKKILKMALGRQIQGVTSLFLMAELADVFLRKFGFDPEKIKAIEKYLDECFELVYPEEELSIVADEKDNRVLEAAVKGNCHFIITGDKDLLRIKSFRDIKIIAPAHFLTETSAKLHL